MVLVLLNVAPRHVPVNGALKELFRVLQMSAVAYACGMELCLANSCSYVTDTVSAHKTEQREKLVVAFHKRRSRKLLSVVDGKNIKYYCPR